MQATGSIRVIVPVHNRIALAKPVFEALQRESDADGFVQITVVDQNSTDGVDALARDHGFHVVRSSAATAGGLRNEGVQMTDSDWLCFIDSDVLVPKGYFRVLRGVLAEQADALVGCNYGLPESTTWSERTWHALTYEAGSGDRSWLNAGNIALSRRLFVSASGFNPQMVSGEDTDLCTRIRQNGGRVYQSELVSAAHLGNPKSLRDFFAKQVWHGQGSSISNRNSIAAIAHATFVVFGVWMAAFRGDHSLVNVAAGLTALNTVPMIAWLSVGKSRRIKAPFGQSVVLLHCYCLARFVALWYRSSRQR